MTADEDLPWWRSRADDLARDEDPVALHLAARNGEATGGATSEATGADENGPRHGPRPERGAEHGHEHEPGAEPPHELGPDCDVCPICLGIAHVRETHPEVADHLVDAVRHLTLAARELMDDVGGRARRSADPGRSTPRSGRADSGFVSIPLDDWGPQ